MYYSAESVVLQVKELQRISVTAGDSFLVDVDEDLAVREPEYAGGFQAGVLAGVVLMEVVNHVSHGDCVITWD